MHKINVVERNEKFAKQTLNMQIFSFGYPNTNLEFCEARLEYIPLAIHCFAFNCAIKNVLCQFRALHLCRFVRFLKQSVQNPGHNHRTHQRIQHNCKIQMQYRVATEKAVDQSSNMLQCHIRQQNDETSTDAPGSENSNDPFQYLSSPPRNLGSSQDQSAV